MFITMTSPFSGDVNTMEIDVTHEQLDEFNDPKGRCIQSIMPELSADEREFIMTGITPAEWDAMYEEEEDA